jgi:hypothetical protein
MSTRNEAILGRSSWRSLKRLMISSWKASQSRRCPPTWASLGALASLRFAVATAARVRWRASTPSPHQRWTQDPAEPGEKSPSPWCPPRPCSSPSDAPRSNRPHYLDAQLPGGDHACQVFAGTRAPPTVASFFNDYVASLSDMVFSQTLPVQTEARSMKITPACKEFLRRSPRRAVGSLAMLAGLPGGIDNSPSRAGRRTAINQFGWR